MASSQGEPASHRFRSTVPLLGGSVGAFGFCLLGIATVIPEPKADLGQIIVGAFSIAFAVLLAAGVGTSFAELTPKGLTYRYNFRRRTIRWASIESLRVAPAPGPGLWSNLVIDLHPTGQRRVGSITGTRKFVQRVVDECERYRAHFAEAGRPQ